MKKIFPELSGRGGQFRFTYKNISYSIVDLTIEPSGRDSNFSKIMSEIYKEYHYELYDGKDCYRFKSLQEAFDSVMNETYKDN
jgi:hypothetical protein